MVGRDAAGDALLAAWQAHGFSTQHILRTDSPTPTMCAIIDRGVPVLMRAKRAEATPMLTWCGPTAGEVVGEIACVDALESGLTGPTLLQHFSSLLAEAQLLILDANLSPSALQVGSAMRQLPSAVWSIAHLPSSQAGCRLPAARWPRGAV